MALVKIKIDGKELEAEEGKTILQAAQENGIDIPVLCNHEALLPYGGCRMCVVQAGPGALKPACATPIAPNMEVTTDSPEIREARMTVLQLLFGERNHYCMFCESTGQCELQDLGYKLGLDHFEFFPYEKPFPQDLTHPYILFDQNRCVLCQRCAHACAELGGHWVLGLKNRGSESLISIDLDVPFKGSTCTSCGLCVQACPTGALVDKRAAYLGRKDQADKIYTRCDRCPVGCGLEVYKRSNFVLKVYGDWNCPTNHGVLCALGRYLPLYDNRPRLTLPKVKEGGVWNPARAEMVAKIMADHLDDAEVLVEGSLSNEDLDALKKLFRERIFSLAEVAPPLASSAKLSDLADADAYLVVGVDLNRFYGTVGSIIKRRTVPGEAKLVLVDNEFNSLAPVTDYVYNLKDMDSALAEARKGSKVVVVYSRLAPATAEAIKDEPRFLRLFLPYESNTLGLAKAGVGPGERNTRTVFFVGENLKDLKNRVRGTYLIALTPFDTDEVKAADLLVPIPAVFEGEGSFINLDGDVLRKDKVLDAVEGVLPVSAWVALIESLRVSPSGSRYTSK
jgi:formate dehydrogenase major subunit